MGGTLLRRIKNVKHLGLPPVFETGVKTPFKQPIADSLSVI
ncbi:TIGR00375 family protein, partial [Bacillus velezensis]